MPSPVSRRYRLGDRARLGNPACASSLESEPIIGKRSRILRETAVRRLLACAGSANARRRRLLQSPRSSSLARARSQAAEMLSNPALLRWFPNGDEAEARHRRRTPVSLGHRRPVAGLDPDASSWAIAAVRAGDCWLLLRGSPPTSCAPASACWRPDVTGAEQARVRSAASVAFPAERHCAARRSRARSDVDAQTSAAPGGCSSLARARRPLVVVQNAMGRLLAAGSCQQAAAVARAGEGAARRRCAGAV